MKQLSRQCGILNISQSYRPPRPVTGIALLTYYVRTDTKEHHSERICMHFNICNVAQLYRQYINNIKQITPKAVVIKLKHCCSILLRNCSGSSRQYPLNRTPTFQSAAELMQWHRFSVTPSSLADPKPNSLLPNRWGTTDLRGRSARAG
jgi:hypothetical protein